MKLTCVSNESSSLPDEQRGRMVGFVETYPLTVGSTYVALGMRLWENVLFVLVRDDWGNPCFARAGLFDLGSWAVPGGWRFSLCSGIRVSGRELWAEPCGAVWGYDELVDDPAHADALGERVPEALAIFGRRMEEAALADNTN